MLRKQVNLDEQSLNKVERIENNWIKRNMQSSLKDLFFNLKKMHSCGSKYS